MQSETCQIMTLTLMHLLFTTNLTLPSSTYPLLVVGERFQLLPT